MNHNPAGAIPVANHQTEPRLTATALRDDTVGTRSRRSPVRPAERPRPVPACRVPDSTVTGISSQHRYACQVAERHLPPQEFCRIPAPPGRRSCAQGSWSIARAPVTGWTSYDRGPQADAEQRIRSAHRAIEIREERRRVLSSRPARTTPALQPTSGVSPSRRTRQMPADAQNAPSGAASIVMHTACHNVPNGGYACGLSVTPIRVAGLIGLEACPEHCGR
jgi:hypothetical protein